MTTAVTSSPAPQGHCSRCGKVWTLKERQGVCQWCGKPASCQSSTSKPRHIKSSQTEGESNISLPNRCEHGLCFSKDGRECYFTVRAADWSSAEIMVTRYENGQWTTPVRASFSNTQSMCPSLADNDQSLYLSRSVDIYRVRRTAEGWSQPELVAAPPVLPARNTVVISPALGTCGPVRGVPGG